MDRAVLVHLPHGALRALMVHRLRCTDTGGVPADVSCYCLPARTWLRGHTFVRNAFACKVHPTQGGAACVGQAAKIDKKANSSSVKNKKASGSIKRVRLATRARPMPSTAPELEYASLSHVPSAAPSAQRNVFPGCRPSVSRSRVHVFVLPFAVDVVLCPTVVYLVKNGKDAAEEVFASFENADTEDDAQANVAKLKSTDAVMNKREFVSVVVRHVHARGLWLAAAAGWGGRWHAGVVLAIRSVVVSTAFVLTLVVVHLDVSVHAWALASALANPRGLPRLVVDPACLSPDPRRRQFFVTTLHEILDKAGDGKVDANMRGLVANANKATKTNFMALNTADGTGSGAQSV